MTVPDVRGQLESWAFDVLMDVVQNTLMAPLPQVRLSSWDWVSLVAQ